MLPISDILIRSISGYIFIVPILLLYFLSLKKVERKQSLFHIIAVFLFCYYLFGILTVTGITGPIDTMLNIILFVPLGFFLPLLYEKYNKIKSVVLTGFLFSLSIEIIQMFDWGSSDINDLMTNTIGACLGYLIYYLLSKVMPDNLRKQFYANKINEPVEVLIFTVFTFIDMITVQSWVIHSILNIK